MLIATSAVFGSSVTGADGDVGTVRDLYFNDPHWSVRYLVVDTGTWLPGRKVLVSFSDVQNADWIRHVVRVPQTQQQIKDSPPIDSNMPVSRQMETELARHYSWPTYWKIDPVASPVPVGADAFPETKVAENDPEQAQSKLRSASEVMGYHISAKDGNIGHVEDLILDDSEWLIRYLVVDTRNWLPGKKVIVSPQWVEQIRWAERTVHINLVREAIKDSPEFDPNTPVNRKYEEHLFDYYGREKYWG